MTTPTKPLRGNASKQVDDIIMTASTALREIGSTTRQGPITKEDLLLLTSKTALSLTEIILTAKNIKTE